MTEERLLIISPVRNEARHLEAVIAAMAAQTRPPDRWVIVDDGSTDATPALLARAARSLPFIQVVRAPQAPIGDDADRLLHAADARAFNYGLRLASGSLHTHIGKIDGDIELPPNYWEDLLERFHARPRLGIAGGVLAEPVGKVWKLRGTSNLEHVRGALKLYTSECFKTIGGMRELLGWDGFDEVLARMQGFETRSFPTLVARHHRIAGSAQGRLRGFHRLGRSMYVEGYPLAWVAARSAKVAGSAPLAISGAAYLAGYLEASFRGVPRFEIDGYRQHLRGELRARVIEKLTLAAIA